MVRKFAADPNAPKRPSSSYFLFMQAKRPSVVASNPQLKSDIAGAAKLIGQMYKALTPEQLKPYQERAAELKSEYEAKMIEYKKTEGYATYTAEKKAFNEEKKKSASKTNLKKMQPNRPKKPFSAFMLYSADRRPIIMKEKPGLPITEAAKLIGASWKAIEADQKAAYQGAAAELKAEYANELQAYFETDEYKTYVAAKEAADRAEAEAKVQAKPVVESPKKASIVKKVKASQPKKAAKAKKPVKPKKAKKTVKKVVKKTAKKAVKKAVKKAAKKTVKKTTKKAAKKAVKKTVKKAKTAKKAKKAKKATKAKKSSKKSAKKANKKRKATKGKKAAKKAKKAKKPKKAAKKSAKKAKKGKKAKKAGKKSGKKVKKSQK